MEKTLEIKECRSCGSVELTPIISLGNQYVTNFVSSEEEQRDIPLVPLELVLCENCKLLQLKHNAPASSMWGDQYWYKSGINRMIREDLKDIVEKAQKIVQLRKGDTVIDIGCNDGTLLDSYDKSKGINIIGFEPSKNVAKEASSKGYKIINNFFNADDFSKSENSKAKIITAISMFYDLDNPNKFLKDIVSVLDKNGIFIIQQNYLIAMLENNAVDNICHEHREYYSLLSLRNLLDKYNLEIFKIEQNEVNGGSIRTYIKFKDNETINSSESDKDYLKEINEKEKIIGLNTKKPYLDFASRIDSIKEELLTFLKNEKKSGKIICGLGASTRGNTTLQYFNLGPDLIDCIFDRNPDKEGKLTVGSLIPITSPDNIKKYNPDYQLVLIWHIFKGIGDDEKEYLNNGGKFILPFPRLRVIDINSN
ncbi:MAG: class I SAM-dependent methyltransferase [Candidatus Nanoarchaeia archaeon]